MKFLRPDFSSARTRTRKLLLLSAGMSLLFACSDDTADGDTGAAVDRDTALDLPQADASADAGDVRDDVDDGGSDADDDDLATDAGDDAEEDQSDDTEDDSSDADADDSGDVGGDDVADARDIREDVDDVADDIAADVQVDTLQDQTDDGDGVDAADSADALGDSQTDVQGDSDLASECVVVNDNTSFEVLDDDSLLAWELYGPDAVIAASREDWADSDESSAGTGRAELDDGEFGVAFHGWESVDAGGVFQHITGAGVVVGDSYTFSIDMHAETDFNVSTYEIKLEFWNNVDGGELIGQAVNDLLDGDYATGTDATDADEWQRISVDGVPPEGTMRVTAVVNFGGTSDQATEVQAARLDNGDVERCP